MYKKFSPRDEDEEGIVKNYQKEIIEEIFDERA